MTAPAPTPTGRRPLPVRTAGGPPARGRTASASVGAAVPTWAVAAAVAVAVASLLPVAVVTVDALRSDPASTLRFLFRPRIGELLANTLILVVVAGGACLVLGTAAAWLVERTTLPLRGLWRVLLIAPLAVPAFVNSYAWVSLRPGTDGATGAVLVTTLSYFPFVVLPVGAVLRGLDPALEDTARALGLSRTAVLGRVVLPQLRFAALGGLLLVTLHLLAEFGALELIRFPTFTVAILEQYDTSFTGATAQALAVVLVLLSLGLLTAEDRARGRARYARVGPGSRRRPDRVPLGRWTVPALAAVSALVVLSLGVPLGALTRWLAAAPGAFSENPTTVADLATTTGTTVLLAVTAAAVTVGAALPVGWLVTHRHDRLGSLVERATYVASGLPGVVVALALVALTVHLPALYQSAPVLVAAYAVLFLPRAVVGVRAALAQAPPELVEAARALGCGPWTAARRVLLPLALPGALAGGAMVFVATSTELTATLLLAPTGTRTLATGFWAASDALDYAAAAPYAALMVALSAPLTWLLLRRPGEEAR